MNRRFKAFEYDLSKGYETEKPYQHVFSSICFHDQNIVPKHCTEKESLTRRCDLMFIFRCDLMFIMFMGTYQSKYLSSSVLFVGRSRSN